MTCMSSGVTELEISEGRPCNGVLGEQEIGISESWLAYDFVKKRNLISTRNIMCQLNVRSQAGHP